MIAGDSGNEGPSLSARNHPLANLSRSSPPLEPEFHPPEHIAQTNTSLFTNEINIQAANATDWTDPESWWFDRSLYTRIVDGDVIRYTHRSAGRVLRKASTGWEQLLESREKEHPHAPWYPFPNKNQWKLGHWLATCRSSQSKIDEFLDMEGVSASSADDYERNLQIFKLGAG